MEPVQGLSGLEGHAGQKMSLVCILCMEMIVSLELQD